MATGTHRIVQAALGAVVVAVALAGCVGGAPMPVPTYDSTSSASPTPKPTAAPALVPHGSAEDNKPFFDAIGEKYFAEHGMGAGAEIIGNLVANGFDKGAMQLTPDFTALDIPVDSIVFSVIIKDECLIGQNSPAGFASFIAPVLGTGGCLIGATRPIDF